ncbi:MAG: hypothetical protein IJL53_03475 [Firmicutes bacterium]|nr:hypothetical protein [Clostridia bacterium]MBQ5959709.1 hypothetical protein [Bacillota bacterium]
MNDFAGMLGRIFLHAVNASIAASWLILAVLAVRFCMKCVPKWTRLLLWAIVGIRLILPVAVRSDISLIPSAETFPIETIYNEDPVIFNDPAFLRLDSGIALVDRTVPTQRAASGYAFRDGVSIAGCVWIAGILMTLLYMGIVSRRMKQGLREAIPAGERVLESDTVSSPFIWGMFRPYIYLPSDLVEPDRAYVIAHEVVHIRRGDPVWKMLAYLIRTIHWFNPLVWVSFILFQRDMELACDERVIHGMDFADKKAYSKALLDCGVHRGRPYGHMLAFGEISVKERVGNVLRHRRPAAWAVPAAMMACLLLAICFLTSPVRHDVGKSSGQYAAMLSGQKEDVLKKLGLTQDEVVESPLRTVRLPYQEYAADQPYVVNLRFNDDDALSGFSYSAVMPDAGEAFAEYDALIRRLIERYGDPTANTAFSNSYITNPNPQNTIKSSSLRMLSEEWSLGGTDLKKQNGAGIILRASIRYSEQYENYTIQLYITTENRGQNG